MLVWIKVQICISRSPWPESEISAAGTFGRVLECWDRKNKDYVAIKIVRNVQKYRDAAMIEVYPLSRQGASSTGAGLSYLAAVTVSFLTAQDMSHLLHEHLYTLFKARM